MYTHPPSNNLPAIDGSPRDVRFDYAEGDCTQASDCQWAGEGCGGGHGMCTNEPQKYEGAVTTCDINDNFPANQEYSCTCVIGSGKCGWTK